MHIYQSGNWHSSGSTLAYRGLREERAPRNLSICSGMVQLQSFAFFSSLPLSSAFRIDPSICDASLPPERSVHLATGRKFRLCPYSRQVRPSATSGLSLSSEDRLLAGPRGSSG